MLVSYPGAEFKDELRLEDKATNLPVLFIQATKDTALPPALSEGIEGLCSKMERESVATSHWALWEALEQVNKFISK
ncbi:MAG: hypothetical protein Q9217_000868 [Psora testacea]